MFSEAPISRSWARSVDEKLHTLTCAKAQKGRRLLIAREAIQLSRFEIAAVNLPKPQPFIQFVVFSHRIPISQVGTDSFAAALKATSCRRCSDEARNKGLLGPCK
jgi:hypothetical protein